MRDEFTLHDLGKLVRSSDTGEYAQVMWKVGTSTYEARFCDGTVSSGRQTVSRGYLQDVEVFFDGIPDYLKEVGTVYYLYGRKFVVASFTGDDAPPYLISKDSEDMLVLHSPRDLRHALNMHGAPVGVEAKNLECCHHSETSCPLAGPCRFKVSTRQSISTVCCPFDPKLQVKVSSVPAEKDNPQNADHDDSHNADHDEAHNADYSAPVACDPAKFSHAPWRLYLYPPPPQGGRILLKNYRGHYFSMNIVEGVDWTELCNQYDIEFWARCADDSN